MQGNMNLGIVGYHDTISDDANDSTDPARRKKN
jgi:hypothetical protein